MFSGFICTGDQQYLLLMFIRANLFVVGICVSNNWKYTYILTLYTSICIVSRIDRESKHCSYGLSYYQPVDIMIESDRKERECDKRGEGGGGGCMVGRKTCTLHIAYSYWHIYMIWILFDITYQTGSRRHSNKQTGRVE